MLPPPFVSQMQQLLSENYPAFRHALEQPAPVSIRLNPFKPTDPSKGIAGILPSGMVPWHPLGLYLPERPSFTLDPLFHAGAYYVQEASSMFLYEVLRQLLPEIEAPNILDMCAAPGGKSTLLTNFTGKNGLLVSNEYVRSRINPLRENLERWGTLSTAVLSADADAFFQMESFFDVAVVDAPCSGEGLFRKDPAATKEWSLPHVEACALRQQRILPGAVAALKSGGILLYSTCTYNASENEQNVNWLCAQFPLERVHLPIPPEWNIQAQGGCYHFFPHLLQGEGFFLSVLRKKESSYVKHNPSNNFQHLRPLPKALAPQMQNWVKAPENLLFYTTPQSEILALPAAQEAQLLFLDKIGNSKWFGTKLGMFKGKDFIPDHALALSEIASEQIPGIELSREQALLFLKKETFDLPNSTALGWTLAKFQGLALGWMKILPNRMNNYLPPEKRIRMNLKAEEF